MLIKTFVEKTGKRGRPSNPVKTADPELDYAVVHKTRENSKLVKVEQKIIYGQANRICEKLAASPSKTRAKTRINL